jgi:hypothetical protein
MQVLRTGQGYCRDRQMDRPVTLWAVLHAVEEPNITRKGMGSPIDAIRFGRPVLDGVNSIPSERQVYLDRRQQWQIVPASALPRLV